MWSSIGLDSQLAPIEDDPCDCQIDLAFMYSYCQEICGLGDGAQGTVTHTSIGPLIGTEWGQGDFYNDDCPSKYCDPEDPNALTGCVATAMAQVMRFWEHPPSYDWAAMPLNSLNAANSDIAELMYNCGQSVSMDYGCNASSADTEDVKHALISKDYSNNIQYKDYDIHQLEDELEMGRPVILRACRGKLDFIVWEVGLECHAWVCEGLRKTTTTYGTNVTVENRELYMNWGWDGDHNHGWLADFQATNDWNFRYGKKMMIKIYPKN